MAEDSAGRETNKPGAEIELADLRAAVGDLAQKLRAYGRDRLEAIRDEVEDDAETLVREGRRRAHELRTRVGEVEARLERNVREHPLSWIGGVLGAIGFGLILGMILRRKD